MRVAFYPPVRPEEPASFLALLSDAVERAGARRVRSRALRLRTILRRREAQVLHLHWLEYLATADDTPGLGWARSWGRIARLVLCLTIVRLRGTAIVWTIHNLTPHEPKRPRAESLLAQAVFLLADEVIVHSEYARMRARARFRGRRQRRIHVIPHANYIGAFPAETRSRTAIRDELGIPRDAFVYLAFGIMRSYKRLPLLATEFRALDGEDLRLLIAGMAPQPEELDALRTHAAADRRILLMPGRVPDESVQGLHLASDAAVLAYADVFSSGALLLALSCGVPVVAPHDGTARELFGPPAVCFFTGSDMRDALREIRSGHAAARTAARRSAERFPWAAAGRATVDVYRQALDGRA